MKKVVIVVLCMLLGSMGLIMSACGGIFTLASLFHGSNGIGFLAISLPSLVVGPGLVWCAVAFMRILRTPRSNASEAAPQDPPPPS